jgi:F0F1-type ATP synthase alpha subunit
VKKVHEFEQGLFRYLDTHEHKLVKAIRDTKQLYPPTEEDLKRALVAYTEEFLKTR